MGRLKRLNLKSKRGNWVRREERRKGKIKD